MATIPVTITRGVPGGSGMFAGVGVAPTDLVPPSPAHVQLTTEDTGTAVVGLLDEEGATPLGGGGIDLQARPQRRPLTPYTSPEAPGLALSMIIEGHQEGRSVERDCRTLERMAGMFLPNDPGPAKLIVRGDAVPHCGASEFLRHRWVIAEQPTWGDKIRNTAGQRTRQQVTLTLLLVTESDELERIKPRQARPNTRPDVARAGDTYTKIARRQLGTARLGRKLAQLNDDRDPNKTLREGKRIRLPSDHLLKVWKEALAKAGS